MRHFLRNPNHRLLVFLAVIIGLIGLLAVERVADPRGGSGIITIVLWFLLLGTAGAMLFDIIHFPRGTTPPFYSYAGSNPVQAGHNPWAQKANRRLLLWCLSLGYEIFVVLVLPVFFGTLTGMFWTMNLPDWVKIPLIIGVLVFLFVMLWSENAYVDAVGWLDPELAKSYRFVARGGIGPGPTATGIGGPLSLTALLLGVYAVFFGWFLSGVIGPDRMPFLPVSVSSATYPPLAGVTFALFVTPLLIFLKYRRNE